MTFKITLAFMMALAAGVAVTANDALNEAVSRISNGDTSGFTVTKENGTATVTNHQISISFDFDTDSEPSDAACFATFVALVTNMPGRMTVKVDGSEVSTGSGSPTPPTPGTPGLPV